MKKLLNTLYITTQGTYLARKGETVVIKVERKLKARFPIHTLSSIVCFGRVSASPELMRLCGLRRVSLAFLSERGRFFARVQGPVTGNVLLRREQYRRADDPVSSAGIARAVIIAKIANARNVVLRAMRDHSPSTSDASLAKAAEDMARTLQRLRDPIPLDVARGCEGEAAQVYFGCFDHLIVSQKEDFFFRERSRRPPLDSVNALLSFLYTLVAHDVTSALEGVGLDPAVGFLHRDRPGRPSLALDLMEEFRFFLADRLALSLINRKQIRGKGFTVTESGAVNMDDLTRKELLVAYQKRKQEEIHHPFFNEKMPVGLLPHAQAMLLARYFRGELDGYPPFLWR
ncbi:MAG: type I-C CRISPR-associated endonuclease Cas1c [Candidatus Ozemobacteraceae bacterium]